MLAKLSRYDEGTLFSSFLSFTVSKELLSFLMYVLVWVGFRSEVLFMSFWFRFVYIGSLRSTANV